jgi:hypothetical protein
MMETEPLECLQDHDGTCHGKIELRESLTGTGTRIARCDKHWDDRLDLEEQINERYPVNAPSDWSPMDAGESWGEDDY